MPKKIVVSFSLFICIILIFVSIMLFGDNTYLSKVIINKPYDVVWNQLSNPNNYATLYPNWVKSVKPLRDNKFQIDDKFGASYNIEANLNKEAGIVDLAIGPEKSRLRLLEIDLNQTAVLHLAKRWKGAGSIAWFFHKRTTDKDLKNAKKVIELSY